MSDMIVRALAFWGLEDASFELFAHRENKTYRVYQSGGDLALRVHRPGYRSDAQLESELQWMAAASEGGISVPDPVATKAGAFVVHVDGFQIDVLKWLPGKTLAKVLEGPSETRARTLYSVAQTAAKFHEVCDAWAAPDGFTRPIWDIDGFVGENPVWGRFWDAPWLDATTRTLFQNFRGVAATALQNADLDFGLVHADLLGENVLLDGDQVTLIDFDDGGWGFRLFELSTTLIRQIDAPDFEDLRAAVVAGYSSVRKIDFAAFDLIMALRATTYVGWIAARDDLSDGAQRREFNTELAVRLIENYMESAGLET